MDGFYMKTIINVFEYIFRFKNKVTKFQRIPNDKKLIFHFIAV